MPAGTTIMISNQHLHRDPAHWANPETFDPARWLDGGVARDPLGSGHFFPFGRGPRACVGGAFAMVFLQTALATIAARAKVHVDSTEPFEEGFFFGVVLPKGVTGKLIARQPQAARAAPAVTHGVTRRVLPSGNAHRDSWLQGQHATAHGPLAPEARRRGPGT